MTTPLDRARAYPMKDMANLHRPGTVSPDGFSRPIARNERRGKYVVAAEAAATTTSTVTA
ncbi:MAG TPA: hypothetical protein VHC69_19250 [Polyangiaceae bacterium]|nr:hypothetical protein [Polyangiaceae bacterium]